MDLNFNADKQHTLGTEVSISGTGLHTGAVVDMTLKPANPDPVTSFNALICLIIRLLKQIATW